MPRTCAVPGCTNVTGKGFSLHKFPENRAKRKLWTELINRPNWKPTAYSVLCEVHFAEDAWDKTRIARRKKLKANAVPTLFYDTSTKKPKITTPTQSILETPVSTNQKIVLMKAPNKNEVVLHFSSSKVSSMKEDLIIPVEDDEDIPPYDPDSEEIPYFDPESEEVVLDADYEDIPLFDPEDYARERTEEEGNQTFDSDTFVEEIQEEEEEVRDEIQDEVEVTEEIEEVHEEEEEVMDEDEKKYSQAEKNRNQETGDSKTLKRLIHSEKMLAKAKQAKIKLQREVKSLKNRLKRVEETKNVNTILTRLKTIFNEDQLLNLIRDENSGIMWSDDTLEKAIKLRLTCGEPGYLELLRQNMPLPSLRTLRRAVKNSKLTKRFTEEVIEYLQTEFRTAPCSETDGISTLKR